MNNKIINLVIPLQQHFFTTFLCWVMEGVECTYIAQVKQRMSSLGVSDSDLARFQDEIDDADHDLESIKEDISDREQSMLVDFFRDECEGGEIIYDILFDILTDDKYGFQQKQYHFPDIYVKPANIIQKQDIFIYIDNETLHLVFGYIHQLEQLFSRRNSDYHFMPHSLIHICIVFYFKTWNTNDNFYMFDDIKIEIISVPLPSPSPPELDDDTGTVILNPGLVIIPDEILINNEYLENIDGITKILEYEYSQRRLSRSYIDFWNEFLEEERPTFKVIADDIHYNEGIFYDYLMEHPPNDLILHGILPVLVKVVNELKYPILDSNKEKRQKQIYTNIKNFFEKQTPDFSKIISHNMPSLIKTCVLFKANTTNNYDFNTFDLFVPLCDIYDRIIFNSGNKIKPMHITGTEWKSLKNIKGHFAALLDEKDYLALNTTMVDFKHAKKASFFPRLEFANGNNKMLINDNLEAFQMISLSFMLFIKSFMCETGNCLEKGNHIYKAPRQKGKNRKKQNKNAPFVPIIKSLIEIKSEKTVKNNNNKSNGMVDDNDIFFHNDNMPLQFDLCIIPKENGHKDFGLITEHKEFEICCASYKTPTNKQEIYKLYGQLIDVFRKTIKAQKNKSNIQEQVDKKDKKPPKRRDDRYCIVFDRHTEKFYIYPPHIKNGGGNITHRKSIQTNKQEPNKSDASVDKNKNNNNNNNDIDNGEEVDNEFSLISHEYNDL
eukprot:548058_1